MTSIDAGAPGIACDLQLGVTASHETYARAAALLWGEAGEFAAAEFARLNREHFAGSIPPMPVIIGLTAFGGCIGLTRSAGWLEAPRITLAPEIFRGSLDRPNGERGRIRGGARQVGDVLLHELIHAALMFRGQDSSHNEPPWCQLITSLSPDVLGREISARPVRPRRVPNPERETSPDAPKTIVRRIPEPGCMSQLALATWPHSLRPDGWYDGDQPIHVPAY